MIQNTPIGRVLVTGGGAGLGAAVVQAVREACGTPVVLDLDLSEAGDVLAYKVDVTDAAAVSAAVSGAGSGLGATPVSVPTSIRGCGARTQTTRAPASCQSATASRASSACWIPLTTIGSEVISRS